MLIAIVLAGCTGSPPIGENSPADTPTSTGAASGVPSTGAGRAPVGPVDPAKVDQGLARMLGGGERYDRLIKSAIIQVGGEVVAEHYSTDSGPDVTHDLFSVTKSVMSILVGIAIAEGSIPGVDATLADLLPDRVPIMAPGMSDVTLGQVPSMTAALPEDELFNDRYNSTADWTAVTLSTGLFQPPGTGWVYASAGSHLLSAILVEATGRPVLDYAREKLFDPLGIVTRPATEPSVDTDLDACQAQPGFAWTVDPTGLHLGFTDIKLAAPEMAKLGQLYLDKGAPDGVAVVPADWVATSTTARAHAESGLDYGYQWWVFDARGHPAFAGFGRAGQLVEVIPDLDLVVAVSSINDPAEFDPSSIAGLVSTWIVPAVAG